MSQVITQVTLTPTPGFCVKCTTLEPGLLPPHPPQHPSTTTPKKPIVISNGASAGGGLLEPRAQPTVVPKGMKVFVNICYDKNVPPPPEASEDAIRRAISLSDEEGRADAGKNGREEEEGEGEGEWYVPLIVSDPRTVKDKAGNPSLVVDCVYNAEVRKRTARDQGFKVYLVELGLQRIEASTGLTLSRTISTPNIAAKGTLEPRIARIPTALLRLHNTASARLPFDSAEPAERVVVQGLAKGKSTGGGANLGMGSGSLGNSEELGFGKGKGQTKPVGGRPLIEEIGSSSPVGQEAGSQAPVTKSQGPAKGILKTPSSSSSASASATSVGRRHGEELVMPPLSAKQRERERGFLVPLDVSWRWERVGDREGGGIEVVFDIPGLDASSITAGYTTLDVEPYRIIVTLSNSATTSKNDKRTIDINRNLSDAELVTKIQERARMKGLRAAKAYLASSVGSAGNSKLSVSEEEEEEEAGKGVEERILEEGDREVESMLSLRRERAFDVAGARARWEVGEGRLVVFV